MDADPAAEPADAAVITVAFDGQIMFRTDASGEVFAPADYAGRAAVAMALAGAAAALAGLPPPPTHTDLLRAACDRLVALGTPPAELALVELARSTERHTDTVESVIELIETLESTTLVH